MPAPLNEMELLMKVNAHERRLDKVELILLGEQLPDGKRGLMEIAKDMSDSLFDKEFGLKATNRKLDSLMLSLKLKEATRMGAYMVLGAIGGALFHGLLWLLRR